MISASMVKANPDEAAEMIATLEAENERLRAALAEIASGKGEASAVAIAQRALDKMKR